MKEAVCASRSRWVLYVVSIGFGFENIVGEPG